MPGILITRADGSSSSFAVFISSPSDSNRTSNHRRASLTRMQAAGAKEHRPPEQAACACYCFGGGGMTRQDCWVGAGKLFASILFSGTQKVTFCPTFRSAGAVFLPSM